MKKPLTVRILSGTKIFAVPPCFMEHPCAHGDALRPRPLTRARRRSILGGEPPFRAPSATHPDSRRIRSQQRGLSSGAVLSIFSLHRFLITLRIAQRPVCVKGKGRGPAQSAGGWRARA